MTYTAESSRAWYLANKERLTSRRKVQRAANKAAILAGKKRYRTINTSKIQVYLAAWRAANPEKSKDQIRRAKHIRRAREYAALIAPIDFKAVRERNGMVCGICTLPIEGKFHYDHIVPLSKGGAHSTENLQLAHPRCNLSKGAK